MGTHRVQRVRWKSVTVLPAKTQTAWKHRDIRSPAFMDAALTVEWLNATKGTAACRRVLGLLAELGALRRELDQPFHPIQWETAERPSAQSAEHLERQNEFAERHRQLNLLLGRYSFKNAMAYNLPTHRWWLTSIPKTLRGPQIEIESEMGFLPKIRVTEAWVAVALARLAAGRQLATVHLCENCQKRWHVALRSIDKFCSQECREHFHVHSEAYRERKRKTQQEYRQRIRENLGSQKGRRSHGTRKR